MRLILLILFPFLTQAQTTATLESYGAVGDGKVITIANMTSGSNILSTGTATFTTSDVGKIVSVRGAGTSGANLNDTIKAFLGTTGVMLGRNAGTSVANTVASWGTNDSAALAAAVTNARQTNKRLVGTLGKTYSFTGRWRMPHDQDLSGGTTHLEVDGRGSTLLPLTDESGGYVYGTGTVYHTSATLTWTDSIRRGQTTITMPADYTISNAIVGRVILIRGPQHAQLSNGDDKYYHGWLAAIKAINGRTLTLSHPALSTYWPTYVSNYRSVPVTLKNFTIDARGRRTGAGINFDKALNGRIANVNVIGTPATSNTLFQGINVTMGVAYDIDSCTVDGGVLQGTGQGSYAISAGGVWVRARWCRALNFSSGIVGGATTAAIGYNEFWYCYVNRGAGTGSAMNFHGGGEGLIYAPTVEGPVNDREQITIRYSNVRVEEAKIRMWKGTYTGTAYGISIYENASSNIQIINNNDTPLDTLPNYFSIGQFGTNYHSTGNPTGEDWVKPLTNLVIVGNSGRGIKLLASTRIGGKVDISFNRFDTSWGINPVIELAPTLYTSAAAVTIAGNVFKTYASSSASPAIKTSSLAIPSARIANNSVYNRNSAFANPQLADMVQIGNATNVQAVANAVFNHTIPLPVGPSVVPVQYKIRNGKIFLRGFVKK